MHTIWCYFPFLVITLIALVETYWYCNVLSLRCMTFMVSLVCHIMMTSSSGNPFRVTGTWCGEFTSQRPVKRSLICVWTKAQVNNRDAYELRRHRTHYDVTVMYHDNLQDNVYPSTLTHWGRDKMDAIFQTTFSNAFPWMKIYQFRLRFHWSLLPRDQLTILQHWFR